MRVVPILLCLPLAAAAQPVAWRCSDGAGPPVYQQAPCRDGLRLELKPVNLMQAYRAPRAASAADAGAQPVAPAVGIGPRQQRLPGGRLQQL